MIVFVAVVGVVVGMLVVLVAVAPPRGVDPGAQHACADREHEQA